MLDLKNYNVQLLPEEAALVMAKARFRLTKDEIPWYSNSACNELQIFYKRKWWEVARTDLMNDVCTGCAGHKTLDEWIEYYRPKMRYGVRLNEFTVACPLCRVSHHKLFRVFAVIDRMTDG